MCGIQSFFPVPPHLTHLPSFLWHHFAVPWKEGGVLQQQRQEDVFPGAGSLSLEGLLTPLFHYSLPCYNTYFTFGFPSHPDILPSFPVIPSQLIPTRIPGVLIHFWFFITYSNFKFSFCASVVC